MTLLSTTTREVAQAELHAADKSALERMHAVDPIWRGVALARDVIAFPDRSILHAGPPVRSRPDRAAAGK